jgi:hypothetical protein
MLLIPTPALHKSPHTVIASGKTFILKLLKQPLRSAPSSLWKLLIFL